MIMNENIGFSFLRFCSKMVKIGETIFDKFENGLLKLKNENEQVMKNGK